MSRPRVTGRTEWGCDRIVVQVWRCRMRAKEAPANRRPPKTPAAQSGRSVRIISSQTFAFQLDIIGDTRTEANDDDRRSSPRGVPRSIRRGSSRVMLPHPRQGETAGNPLSETHIHEVKD